MAGDDLLSSFGAEKIDALTPAAWNSLLRTIEVRLRGVEDKKVAFDEVVKQLQDIGLVRINEVLLPAFQAIAGLTQLGALFTAQSTTTVAIGTGVHQFAIADAMRDRYAPAAYLMIRSAGQPAAAMLGELVSYDRPTGTLTVAVDQASGTGSHSDWTITPTPAPSVGYEAEIAELQAAADDLQTAIAAKASAADIAAAIDALKGGVGPAYDTLVEIAAKLADDDTAIAAIMTALAARLRVDTDAQGLNDTQKSNARTNLGLGTAAVKNTGTAAGDMVEVQAGGKLPALDGSNVTNVGKVVQTAYAEYTAQASITSVIPFDNTVPQNTEGAQILSASITPMSASNRIRASVFLQATCSTDFMGIAALFRSDSANAIASSHSNISGMFRDFAVEQVAGVTSTLTYTVRVGSVTGAITFNDYLGGSQRCVLILEEVRP